MKTKFFFFRLTAIGASVFAISGCAVTTVGVSQEASARKAEIKAIEASTPTVTLPRPGLKVVKGNFLGARPTPTSTATRLPAHLRNVTLIFGGGGGHIHNVAANITKVTGVPVRIAPEVAAPQGINIESGPNKPTDPQIYTGTAEMPLPLPMGAGVASQTFARVSTGPLPLSFKGDLADYLNLIAANTESHWTYENGEIQFFRLITRRFQIAMAPGSFSYRDEVGSGGAGGSGESAGAQFGSSAMATVDAQLTPWPAIEQAIKTMLTAEGKVNVSQMTGVVIVSDVKSSVDRIGKFIESENDVLTRQVRVDVREILVEENAGSSAGIDVSIVYNRFLESGLKVDGLSTAQKPNYSINTTAPSSLLDSATSGSMKVNFAREGYFQGSSIVAQALNGLGKVVSNSTRSIVTMNRVPGRLQEVTDRAYLAKTTPGTGSATGGSAVPGLEPGLVTYGDNMTIVPTIRDNSEVLMQLFSTRSSLVELKSISAGEGESFQQITTPVLARKKYSQQFRVRDGETLVIVSNSSESMGSTDKQGLTGASTLASKTKLISVLLITPRIMGI